MEYYKDLLENDFSKKNGFKYHWLFNLGIGILMLFFAVNYIREYSQDKEIIDLFGGIVFFLNSIVFLLRSFNVKIERFFGKAFILINNNSFILKASPFKTAQHIEWKDIKNVHYTAGKFTFLKNDGVHVKFSVMDLSYNTIREIKEIIKNITELQDITTIE